jgi:hypothetical protein
MYPPTGDAPPHTHTHPHNHPSTHPRSLPPSSQTYTGEGLVQFKDLMDTRAQKNMSELVFTTITNLRLQEGLLAHFRAQAEALFAVPGFERPVRVLSDIDDTFVHSGCAFLFLLGLVAWFESRWRGGTMRLHTLKVARGWV